MSLRGIPTESTLLETRFVNLMVRGRCCSLGFNHGALQRQCFHQSKDPENNNSQDSYSRLSARGIRFVSLCLAGPNSRSRVEWMDPGRQDRFGMQGNVRNSCQWSHRHMD